MGKKKLTEKEMERVRASLIKFQQLQSHFDTLSAFIDARDRESSAWTQRMLSELDRFYIQLSAEFDKIDEQANKAKEKAARGYIGYN